MFRRVHSLRLKLTLWYLAVFSCIQIALFGGLVLLRGREVIDLAVENQMRESGAATIENILTTEGELTSLLNIGNLLPADASFELLSIRDEDGRVLASWEAKQPLEIPFTLSEKIPEGPRSVVFSSLTAEVSKGIIGKSTPLTVMTMPFRYKDQDLYLQAGVSASKLRGFYRRYFEMLFMALPIGMVAAFIAAWLIAGRAVNPIRRLSSAARMVGSSGPGNRLIVDSRDPEFRVLQGELNEALERLEVSFQAQQRFISNLSHEVKTPIAVLLTEAQILKLGEPPRSQLLEFVRLVEGEMQCLAELTETLLELMRAEHNRDFPHGELFSVDDLVLATNERMSLLASGRSVQLESRLVAEGEAEVFGDPRLLRTALDNLVRNAITHSPIGGTVRVQATREDGMLRIDISDQGAGIPEAYLDHIFERFFRVPGTEGGTGLGLHIAKSIVELHRGRIRAANNPAGGCKFSILLPSRGPTISIGGRDGARLHPAAGAHA